MVILPSRFQSDSELLSNLSISVRTVDSRSLKKFTFEAIDKTAAIVYNVYTKCLNELIGTRVRKHNQSMSGEKHL